MPNKTYHILLVEDSAAEVKLFKEALQAWKRPVCLHTAQDAPEALAFLERTQPAPDLIVLNINLPAISGLDLLRSIREHDELASIPAVILSSSEHPRHIKQASEYGARSYYVKPLDFDAYCRTVANIESCCLE